VKDSNISYDDFMRIGDTTLTNYKSEENRRVKKAAEKLAAEKSAAEVAMLP